MEAAIGRITDELNKRGIAGNTVIMLMGDNGFFFGEHGLAGKWYGYEESIRVPLIVHDPRVANEQQGRIIEAIALNIDLAPTILSLAGVPVPNRMQGRNLTPLLEGEEIKWRQDFLYEHLFQFRRIPKSEGLVSLDWKFLQYLEQDPVYEQIFSLEDDPGEIDNVADDPAFRHVQDSLRSRLEYLKKQAE